MTEKVLILGGSGMLGSMVIDYFSKMGTLELISTVRTDNVFNLCTNNYPNVGWYKYDALNEGLDDLNKLLNGVDWIINAIGLTKPVINIKNIDSIMQTIVVNSILPIKIAKLIENSDTHLLQIATDCVYSGLNGHYYEHDNHDAYDVYGKSKSLGEVQCSNVHNLRCSIIGPEPKDFKFLLSWFLNQKKDSVINGFKNHLWNGLTTLHYAKIVYGIINGEFIPPNVQHIVPLDIVTKYDLLKLFQNYYDRSDILINQHVSEVNVDRTLSTGNSSINNNIWSLAGYSNPLKISKMIKELSEYDYNIKI